MYCYSIINGIVVKSEVIFDSKAMSSLREEIIDNCSEVVHHEIKTTSIISNIKFRNVKRGERVGSWNNGQKDIPLYKYSYDEYIFPYLAQLIGKLLNGDTSCIEEIFTPNKAREKHYDLRNKNYAKRKLARRFREYEAINYFDVDARKDKLVELDKEILDYEKMVNIKPVGPYYQQACDLISLNCVAVCSLEEVSKVLDFFENEDSISKIRSKIKK